MTADVSADRSPDDFRDLVDPLTLDGLRDLCALSSPCVAAYLPTHRDRPDLSHDALLLRGLLDQAVEQLTGGGMSETQAADLVAPLRDLVDDRPFWATQAEGLALFADTTRHQVFRLPLAPPAFARVADQPSLIPLIPVVAGDASFYLLAMSQNRVRLFSGTRDAIRELPAGSFPASLEDMERRHQRETELQHQHEPPDTRVATFHGHGGTQAANVVLQHFVLEVATGVRAVIGADPSAPVVLASVAEYLPMVRATGALPTLLSEPVAGNPDQASPAELLGRAWPLVAQSADARADERYADAQAWLGTGRGLNDPADIARAAQEGRIDTLLIQPDAVDRPEAGLLEVAACAAVTTGAALYPASRLPGDVAAVGLLRY